MSKRWFVLFALIIASCGPKAEFHQMHQVPSYGWASDLEFSSNVEMKANSGPFDLNIEIRHAGDYKYSNLFVFLKSEFPDGLSRVDTIECLLARPSGDWYGSGLGDLLSLSIPFRKNVAFNQDGTYVLSMAHGMREDTLSGVTDIGLSLIKSDNL